MRNARLLLDSRTTGRSSRRPTSAKSCGATRRDVEAWELLGRAGELLAQGARPRRGRARARLGHRRRRLGRERSFRRRRERRIRYDGEAYRRADRARASGGTRRARAPPPPDGLRADHGRPRRLRRRRRPRAARRTSGSSSRRSRPRRAATALQLERARLLTSLAENAARRRATPRRSRSTATRPSSPRPRSRRRRPTRRAAARPTGSSRASRSRSRSKVVSEKPVVSAGGLRAQFVAKGGATLLVVTRPDGKDAIQPYTVVGADPASLAFDATGRRLVWDEAPTCRAAAGRASSTSRGRACSTRPRPPSPRSSSSGGSPRARRTPGDADRYTTSLGFSPDGRLLLVVCEGFTADGTSGFRSATSSATWRAARRPVLVDRPFSAPGVVDWSAPRSR